MNRRTFLKRIGQAISATVAFPLAAVGKTVDKPVAAAGLSEDWAFTVFKNRAFTAKNQEVRWSEIADYNSWPENNYCYLLTYDNIRRLIIRDDKLYLLCWHEAWEVVYTGEVGMPFSFNQIPIEQEFPPDDVILDWGDCEGIQCKRRRGCQPIILNDNFVHVLEVKKAK